MNNKYQKKMTLGILLAGVVLLSIGFAAFSANLNVNTTATYTPDSSDFKVVFSKISTGIDTSDVSPTKTPTTITATNGTIDNSVTPTISNIVLTSIEIVVWIVNPRIILAINIIVAIGNIEDIASLNFSFNSLISSPYLFFLLFLLK